MRNEHLDALAKHSETAWVELEELIENGAYEEAVKIAIDLRDLAKRDEVGDAFGQRFEVLKQRWRRRRGFFDRWKRAIKA